MPSNYTIKEAIIQSGEIIGYNVIDPNGKQVKLTYKDTLTLIDKGVTDCKTVKDIQNVKHIYFKNKPNPLVETQDDGATYKIEAKIYQNGKLVKYRCSNSFGESKRLKPSKVWELASLGKVQGIKAATINNKMVLLSDGTDLSSIRKIHIS